MRLPNTITIAGHEIKIKYRKKLFVDGNECWGVYEEDSHTIYLKTGMESTRKMEIFLHECLHVIEDIHTLHLSEKEIKLLGIELLGLIRNNNINLLKK